MSTNTRYAYPIPSRELTRRRHAVSQAMKKQGIDCLVVQNDNLFQGGYVRYFTDVAVDTYRTTVLFTANEETMSIWHGGLEDPVFPPDYAANGITHRKLVPYIQSMYLESEETGKLAAEYI